MKGNDLAFSKLLPFYGTQIKFRLLLQREFFNFFLSRGFISPEFLTIFFFFACKQLLLYL